MNRIDHLFASKRHNILSVYFTAGYPALDSTVTIIRALADSGVDMIELGIPFSDPMADGPVIQRSNEQALKNGMSLKVLFDQIENLRDYTDIPILLMGYLNPVFQYGLENFCRRCHETGIDGVILPDLPADEYSERYAGLFNKYDLHNIFLISPQTSPERIRKIDDMSRGFVYMVSSSSTTGEKGALSVGQKAYFEKTDRMGLKCPRLIGFGISDYEGFSEACKYSSGAIIGSAFVRLIGEADDLDLAVSKFIRTIR